jgi:hypothetical protein
MRNYQMTRQIRIRRQNLKVQAQVDGIYSGLFALLSWIRCRNSEPDDILCAVLNEMAQKQAQDFFASSASYAAYTLLTQ